MISAERLSLIRTVARKRASRINGGLVEAGDLENEAVMFALTGRKSNDGPMQDLMRRQGLVGNHRSSRNNPVRVEIPLQLPAKETPHSGLLAKVDLEKLLRPVRFTRRERRVFDALRRDREPAEIASRMGVSSSRVSHLTAAVLVKLRNAQANEKQLRDLYIDQELSITKIAKQLHCRRDAIWEALTRCGIPLRKSFKRTKCFCGKPVYQRRRCRLHCGAYRSSLYHKYYVPHPLTREQLLARAKVIVEIKRRKAERMHQ